MLQKNFCFQVVLFTTSYSIVIQSYKIKCRFFLHFYMHIYILCCEVGISEMFTFSDFWTFTIFFNLYILHFS